MDGSKMPGGPGRTGSLIRRAPTGWWWAGGIVGALLLLVQAAAFLTDEPLRRYMEREVNHRLTGYTVRVGGLSIHPISLSFDLRNVTIVQDANPDPPVADLDRLNTTFDWGALRHGRVAADMTFERPKVHVNLTHVVTEARSRVPLEDRGWQHALEAVAFDLEINRLQVLDGEVTYVDKGPFKPLRLTHVSFGAENIRNVRSQDRVYPSDIHLEAVVFDTGRLTLDGDANFLAEPYPGIRARFALDRTDIEYFTPITKNFNVSVRHGTLSTAGTVEYAPTVKTVQLERVRLDGPVIEYVHMPQTARAESARVTQTKEAAKQVANSPDVQLRVDRVEIATARLTYVNQVSAPPYRVFFTGANLSVDNLSNQRNEGVATVQLDGKFMGTGTTRLRATFRPKTRSAEMGVKLEVEDTDMVSMNDLVRSYGKFDVKAGKFSVFSEVHVKDGAIDGYVKPLFRDVAVAADRRPQVHRTLGRRLYEGLVSVASRVLKNRPRGEVATVVTISGRLDQPEYSAWQVMGRLLENAFIKAILPGFEPAGGPAGGRLSEAESAAGSGVKAEEAPRADGGPKDRGRAPDAAPVVGRPPDEMRSR